MANGVALNTDLMRTARLSKGLTSRDIEDQARALGGQFDHSSYTRWEKGDNQPFARNVPVLAKVLGLKVDELVKKLEDAA
jgi:transcriptional regulator with XRE-family HTH domain